MRVLTGDTHKRGKDMIINWSPVGMAEATAEPGVNESCTLKKLLQLRFFIPSIP